MLSSSSCSISVSLSTHNISFPITNHPKLHLLPSINISCPFDARKKLKCGSKNLRSGLRDSRFAAFCFKVSAAKAVDFGIKQGSDRKDKFILQPELMPKHVALILDGHRRWAAGKGLSWEEGYRASQKPLAEIIRFLHQNGVKVVTILAFSKGDWHRPKEHIDYGTRYLEELQDGWGLDIISECQARISVIGDTSVLPQSATKQLALAEMVTKCNRGIHVVVAYDYGGRQDILGATKAIATKVKDGLMSLEEINEKSFEEELQTKSIEFPCPDLLIKTGGKNKLYDFMLWQMAYTELYFVDKLWPDMEEHDFREALISYQQRQRRFGGQ